jgi:hypothetical protein
LEEIPHEHKDRITRIIWEQEVGYSFTKDPEKNPKEPPPFSNLGV